MSDPVAETYQWSQIEDGRNAIEIALRPGVADPVAEQIVRSAKLAGVKGVERAATGQRYVLHSRSPLTPHDIDILARRLLANPVVQRYAPGQLDPIFPQEAQATGQIEVIPIRDLDPETLLGLSGSRRAALDLAEMQAIQAHFTREGRDPTDVEFETIAQTWSEHCVHKTFNAHISIRGSSTPYLIEGLMSTFIRAATEAIDAPWVRSVFVDNAGIIDFDEEFELSFKVETHNHPSAIEPFGGRQHRGGRRDPRYPGRLRKTHRTHRRPLLWLARHRVARSAGWCAAPAPHPLWRRGGDTGLRQQDRRSYGEWRRPL